MAIEWGAWDYGGGNGMRVGIEYSTSTVTNSSSSVTFTWDIYTANQYNYNDPQTLTYGDSISGTTSYTNSQGSGTQTQRATKTSTYNYSSTSYGSSPGQLCASASVSGTYNGVTPSQKICHSIPIRPYAAPAAVSNVNSTRQSDTSCLLTWSNNATAGKPYNDFTIQMRTYTGSTWSGYSTVATSSTDTLTSYTKTGLAANTAYQFQVQVTNSAGAASYVASDICYMTPSAPSNVVAAVSGTSINLTWTNTAYISSTISHYIQRSINGGAWVAMTNVAQGTTSWTDTAPGAGSNQYRVATMTNQGNLYSAYTNSNVATTVTPPLAATSLAPNGAPVDLTKDQTFSWKYNPGADGAAQQAFQLRFSNDGGKTWTLQPVVYSATPSYLLPANTLAPGGTWSWQVTTRGVDTGGFGPWSGTATMSLPPYQFEQWDGSTLSGRTLDGEWDGTQINPIIINSVETVQ